MATFDASAVPFMSHMVFSPVTNCRQTMSGWPSPLKSATAPTCQWMSTVGSVTLDASVPGFDVRDQYQSSATPDFCSVSFERTSTHGARKTQETESIADGKVTRQTANGGGKSEFNAPACVKDALTFLFFTRRELGQGRMPPPQQIVFGPLYTARFDYVGAPVIRVAGKPEQSDMLICTMTGPSSSIKFEMYFARDPARTPLLIKVPLQMGSFAMELVR